MKIAGIHPGDSNIEFVGVKETREVLWLRNGATHYFKDLPAEIFVALKRQYLSDGPAVEFISTLSDDLLRQVEIYTYYIYGDVDSVPDWDNATGKLSASENHNDGPADPSLTFRNKVLTLNGHPISVKELRIIHLMREEAPDKCIAEALGISIPTLDYHKKKLFKKAGVQTRTGLINIANKENL